MSINFFSNKKYWFDPVVHKRQYEEIVFILICLNHLLEDTINTGKDDELKILLCEYIANAAGFKTLMIDVEKQEKQFNSEINEEQYLIDSFQKSLMQSQANLLMVNDSELLLKWGINLTIH